MPKNKLTCPRCGGTQFQGADGKPFTRGEVIDGKMVVKESLWACVNCHEVVSEQKNDEAKEEV